MEQAIDAMHDAFASLSSGSSIVPLRYVAELTPEGLILLSKPAVNPADKRGSVKILTQRTQKAIKGVPTIQGIVLLIDSDTGEILSFMDGEYITALRTGAASGLATRFFAVKDATQMALFGCGAQGRTQLEAVACERTLKKVYIYDKRKEAAEQFIADVEGKYSFELIYTEDNDLLCDVDIICTATNATSPLFKIEELKPGVHINAIGSFQPHMQELDPHIIQTAKVYVDQFEPCLKESGDLIVPLEAGMITKDDIIGEIGAYCLNIIEGRESEDDITVFKSVGVAIQDHAVANDVYNSSLQKFFGKEIDLFS